MAGMEALQLPRPRRLSGEDLYIVRDALYAHLERLLGFHRDIADLKSGDGAVAHVGCQRRITPVIHLIIEAPICQ